jgi:hypothetical protein
MSAGKGDKPRPVNGDKYRANYDTVFGMKNAECKTQSDAEYPRWICRPCGWQYGRFPRMARISTWHEGICDICGTRGPVSEPRDFGHLRDWKHVEMLARDVIKLHRP